MNKLGVVIDDKETMEWIRTDICRMGSCARAANSTNGSKGESIRRK